MSADFEVFCMGLFCGIMGTLLMIGAFAYVDSKIHKEPHDGSGDGDSNSDESDRQHDGLDRNISSHTKELTDEELAVVLMAIRATGLCPSRDEKEYLAEAARRLQDSETQEKERRIYKLASKYGIKIQ